MAQRVLIRCWAGGAGGEADEVVCEAAGAPTHRHAASATMLVLRIIKSPSRIVSSCAATWMPPGGRVTIRKMPGGANPSGGLPPEIRHLYESAFGFRSRADRNGLAHGHGCGAPRHREKQAEHGAVRSGSLHRDLAVMLLHDVVDDGEAKADALLLAVADEGLKQTAGNLLRNTRAVVGHANLGAVVGDGAAHVDPSGTGGHRLRRVEEQIEHHALEFCGIEPAD